MGGDEGGTAQAMMMAAPPGGIDQDVGVDEQSPSAPVVIIEVLALERDAVVPGLVVDRQFELGWADSLTGASRAGSSGAV